MQCTVLWRHFCPSLCLSVSLSVKRVHCDKRKETWAHILIPYVRTFILVFRHEKWLYLKFWDKHPIQAEMPIFNLFVHSASAVTSSEKSSTNTDRKSNTCFPMILRWTSYVATKPFKRGLKTQNGRFLRKLVLHLKKVCYKVSLCEYCQRASISEK